MRELHRAEPHLLGRVGGNERKSFCRQVEKLGVTRCLRLEINFSAFVRREFCNGPPGSRLRYACPRTEPHGGQQRTQKYCCLSASCHEEIRLLLMLERAQVHQEPKFNTGISEKIDKRDTP